MNFSGSRYAFGIQLSAEDGDLLEQLKADLKYAGPLYKRTRRTNMSQESSVVALEIHDHLLVDTLMSLGMTRGKGARHFPSSEALPEEFEWDYVRGLVDGDGWIGKVVTKDRRHPNKLFTKYRVGYSGTIDMVTAVREKWGAEHLSIRTQPTKRSGVDFAQVELGGNKRIKPVLDALYGGEPTRFIKRKLERYKDYLDFYTQNCRAS